jgi:hypothetical protein
MRAATIIKASLVCLVALLLAGCGSKRTASARITGIVKVCGGPLLGEKASCSLQAGYMFVFDRKHHLVARQRLRRGRYSFSVPPATYELVERNSANSVTHATKAKAAETTVVNFVIEAS